MVIEAVAVNGEIRGSGIGRRSLNQTHHAPFRHLLRRHVGPMVAAVACEMNQAVIAAGPDEAFLDR